MTTILLLSCEWTPGTQSYRVCLFVLCNRHWFNRVPEANLGIAVTEAGASTGGLLS
jgi:hypothetical protein